MRRIRCHVDVALAPQQTVALPEAARAHLARVLRLRAGDRVDLFNGDGHDYPARLAGAGPQLSAEVLERRAAAAPETTRDITLVQALARGEKMDWVVQKATEIGVARIAPVASRRCDVRLDEARADRRLAHWRKVAISACEQCGRARIPAIEPAQDLARLLSDPKAGIGFGLVLDPEGDRDAAAALPAAGPVALAVGPEGGFEAHELDAFDRAGWRRWRLGERILRTETAGLVAAAVVLARSGEL